MKALSQFAANNCENAKESVCHCRCGGALHGARRLKVDAMGNTLPDEFEKLPETDPHFVPSKKRRKELAKERKKERKAEERRKRAERFGELIKEYDRKQAELGLFPMF